MLPGSGANRFTVPKVETCFLWEYNGTPPSFPLNLVLRIIISRL